MDNQQLLIDSIEKMGVWMSKHPSGTLILTANGERTLVHPHEDYWVCEHYEGYNANPFSKLIVSRKDVSKLVLHILHWTWKMGVGQ